MKRAGMFTLVALVLIGFSVPQADALPVFKKEWEAKYSKKSKNKKFVAKVKKAKCNLCHYGRSKKNRNDYGKALTKAGLVKAKFKRSRIRKEGAKVKKEIMAAFDKVAKMKNAKKKTFGSLIKAGDLPGTDPKKK